MPRIHQMEVAEDFQACISFPEPLSFSGVVTDKVIKRWHKGAKILVEPVNYRSEGGKEVCDVHLYNRLFGNYIGKIVQLPTTWIKFPEEKWT